MNEEPQTVTVAHDMSWGVRAVGVFIGCGALCYPILGTHGWFNDPSPKTLVVAVGAIFVGVGLIAIFVLMPSTCLAADRRHLRVRTKGLMGRRSEILPLDQVESAVVACSSTELSGFRYHVQVKLKGRRLRFMGPSHEDKSVADAECAAFLKAAGRQEDN